MNLVLLVRYLPRGLDLGRDLPAALIFLDGVFTFLNTFFVAGSFWATTPEKFKNQKFPQIVSKFFKYVRSIYLRHFHPPTLDLHWHPVQQYYWPRFFLQSYIFPTHVSPLCNQDHRRQ